MRFGILLAVLVWPSGELLAQPGGDTPEDRADEPAPADPTETTPAEPAPTESTPGAEPTESAPGAEPSESAPGDEQQPTVAPTPSEGAPVAEGVEPVASETDVFGEPMFDDAGWGLSPVPFSTHMYGYIDAQYSELAFTGGFSDEADTHIRTEFREEKPRYGLNFNLMLQGDVFEKFHWFINLGSTRAGDPGLPDSPVGLRNAWVEVPLYREYLQLRVGKTYRRFGLYNEILDAAPTFPGVEQPEFLVAGQFLLTRTTNVMLHGSKLFGEDRLTYTLHTGADEVTGNKAPVGGDLRYALGDLALVGSSFYWSNESRPTRGVGAGQPLGGVINWMAKDEYVVYGGYGQLTRGPWLLQVEYWRADHDAERNPVEMLKVAAAAEINQRQRDRFFNGAADPTASDVVVPVSYAVQTAWSRAAYEFDLGSTGTLSPYLHLEWYSHPEAIEGGALGGNEAGHSDDGQFYRTVLGFVFRPVPAVALKAEMNPHVFQKGGNNGVVGPFQASLSYYWALEGNE